MKKSNRSNLAKAHHRLFSAFDSKVIALCTTKTGDLRQSLNMADRDSDTDDEEVRGYFCDLLRDRMHALTIHLSTALLPSFIGNF